MASTVGPWGAQSLFPPLTCYRLSRSLAAATAESMIVPATARKAIFRCSTTGPFYVNSETTATIPGDVTDGSASAVNPGPVSVVPGSTISLIAPDACVITADFFK